MCSIDFVPFQRELDQTLPILQPDLSVFSKSPEKGVRHMWVGHATSLIQFDGLTLLTDPIFSDRKSPSQAIGPKRYRKPPCTIADLPNIDCVLISHNHYDHLDHNSVLDLHKRCSQITFFLSGSRKSFMRFILIQGVTGGHGSSVSRASDSW